MPELPEVGPWAQDKLARLRSYLAAYTTILSKQRFQGFVYVDAFAGAGRVRLRQSDRSEERNLLFDLTRELRSDAEVQQIIHGSPKVALEIEPPFTHYVFLELNSQRVIALKALEEEYRGRRRVFIREGDCNRYLSTTLIARDWTKWRGVVFLDPFGMNVPWKTIARLAETGALEVFLNFPVGMAIQRLLKRSGQFSDKERARLDDYFGDPAWFEIVYPQPLTPDLFGNAERSKSADAAKALVEWYRQRLEHVFGFASSPYLIRNTKGGHLYYLIFAGHNKTGYRIANYILSGGLKA